MTPLARAKDALHRYNRGRTCGSPQAHQIIAWTDSGAYQCKGGNCLPRIAALSTTDWGQRELALSAAVSALNLAERDQFNRYLKNLRPNRNPEREKFRKSMHYLKKTKSTTSTAPDLLIEQWGTGYAVLSQDRKWFFNDDNGLFDRPDGGWLRFRDDYDPIFHTKEEAEDGLTRAPAPPTSVEPAA